MSNNGNGDKGQSKTSEWPSKVGGFVGTMLAWVVVLCAATLLLSLTALAVVKIVTTIIMLIGG